MSAFAQEVCNTDSLAEEPVYLVVEHMPKFPRGQAALFRYLSKNVQYPAFCQEKGIEGRAVCQFTVERDGSIEDVNLVHSSGNSLLDNEAVRVIKSMPKWKPGRQRGKLVRVKYAVPVNFRLPSNKIPSQSKHI